MKGQPMIKADPAGNDPLDVLAGKIRALYKIGNEKLEAASLLLLEAKKRVDAGELGPDWSWKRWYLVHLFPHISKRWVQVQLKIAGSPDPKQAAADYRAANAESHRKARQRQKEAQRSASDELAAKDVLRDQPADAPNPSCHWECDENAATAAYQMRPDDTISAAFEAAAKDVALEAENAELRRQLDDATEKLSAMVAETANEALRQKNEALQKRLNNAYAKNKRLQEQINMMRSASTGTVQMTKADRRAVLMCLHPDRASVPADAKHLHEATLWFNNLHIITPADQEPTPELELSAKARSTLSYFRRHISFGRDRWMTFEMCKALSIDEDAIAELMEAEWIVSPVGKTNLVGIRPDLR